LASIAGLSLFGACRVLVVGVVVLEDVDDDDDDDDDEGPADVVAGG
jgi:hypothetical protein